MTHHGARDRFSLSLGLGRSARAPLVPLAVLLLGLAAGCEARLVTVNANALDASDNGPGIDTGFVFQLPEAGVPGPEVGVSCTPTGCNPPGGQYCGKIDDGCGHPLDCGSCAGTRVCGSKTPNVCGAEAECQPLTCLAAGGVAYCGTIGDGCDGTLECGDCPTGQSCGVDRAHVCKAPPVPGCQPLACTMGNTRYCGTIGDTCGGTLSCGDCQAAETCGGGGIAGVCGGNPTCKPLTCSNSAGSYCGKISDGCGGSLDCGACATGQSCGGGGIAGVCGGGASCKPLTCSSAAGTYCGTIGDGCGGALSCGDCPSGQTCGTGAQANVCLGGPPPNVPPNCKATTCAQASGRYCGTVGDGCGKTLTCGACPTGQTCGAVTANVCGAPPVVGCKAITCSNAAGQYCGKIGDGCGGTLDCGNCPTGLACGGSGVAGICAPGNGCQSLTCTQANGKYCGKIGDGCGHLLDCGGCTGLDSCAGGGNANVCGHGSCTNLCTKQQACSGGGTTVVVGTVVAPTPAKYGKADPIYNAIVYIPNGPVAPLKKGLSCDRCGAEVSGTPLVSTLSAADGKFRLDNAPVGDNIPLVIQLGRWRRQVIIPHIDACSTNSLPEELTRLPRNRAEGDIPQMGIATGKVDKLECVLRKIGIDDAEFTLPSAPGRVHLYKANGAVLGNGTPNSSVLLGDPTTLDNYDMVVLSCEGKPYDKPKDAQKRLVDYSNAGGRLFATHYSYTWLYNVAPFSQTADWQADQAHPPDPLSATVDQSFPKGVAFATWLQAVKASTTLGQLKIHVPRHDLNGVKGASQRWISSTNPTTVQHYTFNTPVGAGADAQCGRVLFSDFHVDDADSAENVVFPAECTDTPLTAQEKVLEFMLFDLASCVQPDTQPTPLPGPPPPPVDAPPAPPLGAPRQSHPPCRR